MRALVLLFFGFISYLVALMAFAVAAQSSTFDTDFELLASYRNVLPAAFLGAAVIMAVYEFRIWYGNDPARRPPD